MVLGAIRLGHGFIRSCRWRVYNVRADPGFLRHLAAREGGEKKAWRGFGVAVRVGALASSRSELERIRSDQISE